jgi:hypothetical protein
VVVRVLANENNRLWHKKDGTQTAFRPQDLHITHVIFIGMPAELINRHDLTHQLAERKLGSLEGVSLLKSAPAFGPLCFPAIESTLLTAGTQEAEEHPLLLRALRKGLKDLPDHAFKDLPMLKDKHYESKRFLKHWLNKREGRLRLGTLVIEGPRKIAEIMRIDVDQVEKGGWTGIFAIEVPFKRGEALRQAGSRIPRGVETVRSKHPAEGNRTASAMAEGQSSQDTRTFVPAAVAASSTAVMTTPHPKNLPAQGPRLTFKQDKRHRQKAAKSTDELHHDCRLNQTKIFNGHLRLAHASYLHLPLDYYGAFRGLWVPPRPNEFFDKDHAFVLVRAFGQDPGASAVPTDHLQQTVAQTTAEATQSLEALGRSVEVGGDRQVKPMHPWMGPLILDINNDDVHPSAWPWVSDDRLVQGGR